MRFIYILYVSVYDSLVDIKKIHKTMKKEIKLNKINSSFFNVKQLHMVQITCVTNKYMKSFHLTIPSP